MGALEGSPSRVLARRAARAEGLGSGREGTAPGLRRSPMTSPPASFRAGACFARACSGGVCSGACSGGAGASGAAVSWVTAARTASCAAAARAAWRMAAHRGARSRAGGVSGGSGRAAGSGRASGSVAGAGGIGVADVVVRFGSRRGVAIGSPETSATRGGGSVRDSGGVAGGVRGSGAGGGSGGVEGARRRRGGAGSAGTNWLGSIAKRARRRGGGSFVLDAISASVSASSPGDRCGAVERRLFRSVAMAG